LRWSASTRRWIDRRTDVLIDEVARFTKGVVVTPPLRPIVTASATPGIEAATLDVCTTDERPRTTGVVDD